MNRKSLISFTFVLIFFFASAHDTPIQFTKSFLYILFWTPMLILSWMFSIRSWIFARKIKSIFPYILSVLSIFIVVYASIWQILFAFAGFPKWIDICKVGKFGIFEIKRQQWKLAESHQDYRTQATIDIVSGIRISFPFPDEESKHCLR